MGLNPQTIRRDPRGFWEPDGGDFLGSLRRRAADSPEPPAEMGPLGVQGAPSDALERVVFIEGGQAPESTHPFKLSIVGDTQVRVADGTVNDLTPTGMGTEAGEDGFVLTLSGEAEICARCVFDTEGTLTAVTVVADYAAPTESVLYIKLGIVRFDSGVISSVSNYITSSLGVRVCPTADYADYWQIGPG